MPHIASLWSGLRLARRRSIRPGATVQVASETPLAISPWPAADLDSALAELGDRFLQDGQMRWEYLLVTATRC